jgi:hypothetical protein
MFAAWHLARRGVVRPLATTLLAPPARCLSLALDPARLEMLLLAKWRLVGEPSAQPAMGEGGGSMGRGVDAAAAMPPHLRKTFAFRDAAAAARFEAQREWVLAGEGGGGREEGALRQCAHAAHAPPSTDPRILQQCLTCRLVCGRGSVSMRPGRQVGLPPMRRWEQ